jgi:uncharacterized delta-60 repeat protein
LRPNKKTTIKIPYMKKITIAFFMLFSAAIFAQDGVPDTSYGTNGYVLVNNDDGATLPRFIQPDGKLIYVQGAKFKRLNADGTPDATFGVNGSVNIAQPFEYIESFTVNNDHITLITKAVYDIYTLGRYNFDGTVDATLGSGAGYTGISLGDDLQGHVTMREAADGKLLIAGNSDTAYGSYDDYYVRRYNADGTYDSTFNFDASELGINIGYTGIGYATIEDMYNLYLRPDGSVIVSGVSGYRDSTSSGHQQSTFAIISGSSQPAVKSQNHYSYYAEKSDMAFDADGAMYLLGGGVAYPGSSMTNVIQKWTASGNTASSFGTAGVLTLADLNLSATSKADFSKIMIQPDGKILLAGNVYDSNTFGRPYLIMARYLTDGSLDTTFGTNGYTVFDIPHPNTPANQNSITNFFASADFSSIYMTGYNQQNAVVFKYNNPSVLPATVPSFDAIAPICAGDAAPLLQATSNNGITGTWSPAVIDNSASGTYTFTPGTGQNATTATLSVTVNQPTAETITETACESYTYGGTTYTESGTYTQLSVNPAGCTHTTTLNVTVNHNTEETIADTACSSYTYGGTTYTESGTYTQVTTNASGCEHTTTLNLTISPVTEVTGEATQSFDQGAQVSNIATSPEDVVWYSTEDDAIAQTNPIASTTVLVDGTTYYAVFTSAQGCSSAPFAVTTTVNLGVKNFDDPAFALYPNPASGVVFVSYSANIVKVSVSNVLGQQVLSKTIGATQGSLDVSGLGAGTYFVKIYTDNGVKSAKVVKY